MGSVSNPFANYKDCSQGICSVYCSQWCYIIFPPPPPNYLSFDDNNGDDSGPDFSPLIIAVIGILASAFLLITYYTIISRYCRRRGDDRDIIIADLDTNGGLNDQPWQQPASSTGLDDVTIKSITICKYKKGDGLVEGTDCSVCLSEFQEDESLRLLPKCNHAFHLPCIDTWLKSNSSCPLCRSNITIIATTNSNNNNNNTTARAPESRASIDMAQHRMNDTIIVVQDLFERSESVVEQEAIENHVVVPIKTSYNIQAIGDGDQRNNNLVIGQQQYLRRCMSLDSSSHQGRGRISIADILSISNEEEEDDHLHMLQNLHSFNGDHLNLVVIKRSVSTGGFMSSRHGEKEEIF